MCDFEETALQILHSLNMCLNDMKLLIEQQQKEIDKTNYNQEQKLLLNVLSAIKPSSTFESDQMVLDYFRAINISLCSFACLIASPTASNWVNESTLQLKKFKDMLNRTESQTYLSKSNSLRIISPSIENSKSQ